MKPHVLIFALFVIAARAATIPNKDTELARKNAEIIKDIVTEEKIKEENLSSEPELVEEANSVQEVENNLRKGVHDIPVKVVVEDVKSELEKENNEVVPENEDNVDIKRVEIDLKNPGEPQRQEHDTQNPEHFSDGQEGLAAVKQQVIDSQNVFQGGVQGIQQQIQSWWIQSENESLKQIRKNIEDLQLTFQNQITKLNDTVQKIWQPYSASVPSIKSNVESSLQYLENNVKTGVKSLAQGVEAISSVREDTKNETQPGFGFGNWQNYFQYFNQAIQNGFQNITNSIQSNYGNGTQNANNANNTTATDGGNAWQNWGNVFNVFRPPSINQNITGTQVQADEGAAPAKPPTLWNNIQNNIQNYFRPNAGVQSDTPVSQPAPNRPVLNAIQPLFQNVANFINPQANQQPQAAVTQAPAKPEEPKPEANQEGTNAVPVDTKPDKEQEKEKPVVTPTVQSGPIKQLIEKNPIVQGIAGAVQRIQHTVINPEKPRDAAVETEKGHGYKPGGTGM